MKNYLMSIRWIRHLVIDYKISRLKEQYYRLQMLYLGTKEEYYETKSNQVLKEIAELNESRY